MLTMENNEKIRKIIINSIISVFLLAIGVFSLCKTIEHVADIILKTAFLMFFIVYYACVIGGVISFIIEIFKSNRIKWFFLGMSILLSIVWVGLFVQFRYFSVGGIVY